ncbi:MAG: hypothetical protein NVS3B3_16300 [Aquirhabdus sp.]
MIMDVIELNLPNANLHIVNNYVKDTGRMFEYFKNHLSWLQDNELLGTASYCPMGTDYLADSGKFRIAQKMDSIILKLMDQLNHEFNVMMNSCLAIFFDTGTAQLPYRTGVAPSLDYEQPILSIFYGAPNTVTFKDINSHKEYDFLLSDGDLLIMPDSCQKNYLNAVKPSDQYTSPRLSLSFRRFNIGSFY